MREILSIIVDKIYWLGAIILIFFAVVVTITPTLNPILNHYNRNFTAWAETLLHKPVKIEKIAVKWHGLHPVLDLQHVVVFDKPNGRKIFQLSDLQVSLYIAKSLWQHKAIISPLLVEGGHLVLLQHGQKQWVINGLTTADQHINNTNEEFTAVVSWLLSQSQLVLQDFTMVVKTMQYGTRTINHLDLMLSNHGKNHYLRGKAFLAKYHQSPFDLVLLLHGKADDIKHLQGKFYLQASRLSVKPWLADKAYFGLKYQHGNVNFKLWGDWRQQKINNVQLALQLDNFALQPENKATQLTLNQLTANLSWQHLVNGGWKLRGDNINLVLNRHHWATTVFGLSILHPTPTTMKQFFTVDDLQLQDLQSLLVNFDFLPKEFCQRWRTLAPNGEIKDVKLVHYGSLKKLSHYSLQFDFANLQWQRYKKIPGFSGLTGGAVINEHNGQIMLRSNNVIFNAPYLFRQPLLIKQIATQVQWQQAAASWVIRAKNIKLRSPQIDLQGNMQLRLPVGKGSPHINLQASYTARQLGQLKKYFPAKIMSKRLVAWLDQAFVKGTNAQGKLLLFGALNKFPYVHHDGQFIVDSEIQGLKFNYHSNWPSIENLSGNLVFNKRKMHFTLQSGSIAHQEITALTGGITDMAAQPQVHINSQIQLSDINMGKQFVLHSPLRDTIGKTLTPLQMQGKAALRLKLTVPLQGGATIVDGKLQLQQNNLSIPIWNLRFNKINGALHFTNDAVSANQLTVNFFNKPANVNVKTLYVKNNRITRFNITSILQAATVKSYFAIKDQQRLVSGRTPFIATLDIPAKGKTHLLIKSQLRGININLPKPYYKAKKTPRNLRVDSYFTDAKVSTIKIYYASLFAAALAYTTQGKQLAFSRANIHFGNGATVLPKQQGIVVSGRLQDLSWPRWQAILMPYLREIRKTHSIATKSNAVLKRVDLHIKQLRAYQQRLHNVFLHIVPTDHSSWAFSFDSQKIAGRLIVPLDYKHQTTKGYFKRLNLYFFNIINKKRSKQLVPQNISPIDISADQFSYNDHDYGKVHLIISPLLNGLKISTINIINSLYVLKASGQWLYINEKDQSKFSGTLYTRDLGALLQQQGFTDHIDQGKGTATFVLAWPGMPAAFWTQELRGNITAQFTDGLITGLDQQTKQKIGLGKLVNALSLSSLVHHLTLDFSDLKQKGYNFSVMRGELRLKNGNVSIGNLYLNGNVAEVYVTGELGLKKKFYDLNLIVNPYITSSLPVLATLIAGPIVGVATWAVNKLVRPAMKKAIVYRYHIGGSWHDPVIKKNDEPVDV